MCIIFATANGNPQPGGYKLIIASNRDEFYSRPASIAKEWKDNPFVYGGLFRFFFCIICFFKYIAHNIVVRMRYVRSILTSTQRVYKLNKCKIVMNDIYIRFYLKN